MSFDQIREDLAIHPYMTSIAAVTLRIKHRGAQGLVEVFSP